MDREILFRGKMKGSKTGHEELDWAFGDLVRELETGRCFIVDLAHFDENTKLNDVIIEVAPKTVCQYTGLTDKNGRKIFEGDIITYQHDNDDCPFPNKDTKRRVGRVYFQKFRSCFAVAEGKNGSDMANRDLFKYVQNGNKVEVIGNIFDNPELATKPKCSECKCSNCFGKSECCPECEGPILGCEEYSETDIYNTDQLEGETS